MNESFTVEDFAQKLLQYGVTVKESRGRFFYLTPDRTKPITARKLGDSFDKATVLAALEQNDLRSEHTLTSNDGISLDLTLSSIEGASDRHTPKQSVVDREAKRAEGKGIGYDRWASMHNLKAWSKTFMYLQEHDLLSPDKLSAAVDAAGAEAREARSRYDAAAAKVTDKKAMLEAMDNYRNTYPIIKEYRMIRKEKTSRSSMPRMKRILSSTTLPSASLTNWAHRSSFRSARMSLRRFSLSYPRKTSATTITARKATGCMS